MPAKDTNTIQFVSGGDSGVGSHPRHTNKLAAAQAPLFVLLGGDLAYENGNDPNRFLEFLENYSNDLRDDQQRLVPVDRLHRQSRSRRRLRAAAKASAVSSTRCSTACFPTPVMRRWILANTCRWCCSTRTTPRRLQVRRPIGWRERSRSARIARTCSWSITCRRIRRIEPLKGRSAAREPAQKTGNIGCRCSNGTTSMPFRASRSHVQTDASAA